MKRAMLALLWGAGGLGCSGEMGQEGPIKRESWMVVDLRGSDVGVERAGCNFIQWCDQPGSPIGTVCVQMGCSFAEAYAECLEETKTVCGAATPTWIIR
jgi:hypothetical protein